MIKLVRLLLLSIRKEGTHMNSCITTGKCKDATDRSNKEGKSLRWEPSKVEEVSEDFLGCAMVGHIGQGNENREETQNVKDQNHALKSGKDLSSDTVDADRKDNDSPV
jgi:hypothetical protein